MTIIETTCGSQTAICPPIDVLQRHAEKRRFRFGGGEIVSLISRGAEPYVLFLHGNSSSKRIWEHQLDCLDKTGRGFIAIDLPGHGESSNSQTPCSTYSFPGYAAAVSCVLDALRCEEADVVGWSLGGHVGLELLATDHRVRSLLISGTPPARPCADVLEKVFHASKGLDFAGRVELSEAEIQVYGASMLGEQAARNPDLLADIRRTDGWARRCMFENVLRGVGADEQLAVETTMKPVCVVHGEFDPFVRLDYLRSLKFRTLWNGHIYVMGGVGHAPHWEDPRAFNEILQGFLCATAAGINVASSPLQGLLYAD